MKLYHCTKLSNLKSILKTGLKPNKPEYPFSKEGVYLSKHPFEWMHYATSESQEAGAMIEVDIEGLQIIENMAITHKDECRPEYICTKPIPVERFKRISISTDENPTSFEQVEEFKKLYK